MMNLEKLSRTQCREAKRRSNRVLERENQGNEVEAIFKGIIDANFSALIRDKNYDIQNKYV